LAVTTTDAVSTRATSLALPAPLSDQQTADNAQNNTALPAAVVAEESAATVSTSSFSAAGLASNITTSGQSTSFLAQLYSQGADADNTEDTAQTARFAPAPAYNTFVGYGYIKYKPSNAGIPAQRSPLPAPVTPSQPQVATDNTAPVASSTPQTAEVQPVANENTAVGGQQPTAEPVNAPVTFTAPVVFAPPANQNAPAADNATDANGTPAAAQSTVTANAVSSNVQAYSQTQSRNQTNLTYSEPQIVVAG
jgi:hypothetical protein